MSTVATAVPGDRFAFGMVLACAMMVAMGFGAVVNIAVFLTPLGAEFGWSRAELSLAYSVASVCTGLGRNLLVLGLLYIYTVPRAARALRIFLSPLGWQGGPSR